MEQVDYDQICYNVSWKIKQSFNQSINLDISNAQTN